jgi:hypothetical protein
MIPLNTQFLFFFILLSQQVFSQDFNFQWKVAPFFGPELQMEIRNMQGESKMILKFEGAEETHINDLDQSKLRRLSNFLSNYSFPHRNSVQVLDSNARHYLPTVFKSEDGIVIIDKDTLLQDFSGLVFNGDTLKLSPGDFRGDLKYDSIKEEFYFNVRSIRVWTDGTTFYGKYTTSNNTEDFQLYNTRLTNKDLELISLLLSLIDSPNSPHYLYIESNLKEIKN